jgi:hypothetical protein
MMTSDDESDRWFARYCEQQKRYLQQRKKYASDRRVMEQLIDNLQQQLDDSVGPLCQSVYDTDGHVLTRVVGGDTDTFMCVRCGGETAQGRLLGPQEYSNYYAVCRDPADSSGHCFRVDSGTCERCGACLATR